MQKKNQFLMSIRWTMSASMGDVRYDQQNLPVSDDHDDDGQLVRLVS